MCNVVGIIKGSKIDVKCLLNDNKTVKRYSGEMDEKYDEFINEVSKAEQKNNNTNES